MITKILLLAIALVFMPMQARGGDLVLPPPAEGSFFTVFASLKDCRLVAFDGFRIYIENESGWEEIGKLPDEFLGCTDPAFILPTPDGQDLLLGAGFGGLGGFFDPSLNGNLFHLPIRGGEANLVARVPFHVQGAFRSREELFLTVGSPTFADGSVQLLRHLFRKDRRSIREDPQVVIQNIPGAPGGIVLDKRGNLYVGIGFGRDRSRTGEIRTFRWNEMERAIHKGETLDFERGSSLTRVLNAGQLLSIFEDEKDLLVGGGDLFGTTESFGFFAIVDSRTGEISQWYDPTDGDPEDHDFLYFALGYCSRQCLVSAVDLNTFFLGEPPLVYTLTLCENKEGNWIGEDASSPEIALAPQAPEIHLLQVVPNPFQSSTAIQYELQEKSQVSLFVYDVTGRLVETLVNESQVPGVYIFQISNNQLPSSGVYFARLTTRFGKDALNPLNDPELISGQGQEVPNVTTRKLILLR